MLKYKWLEEYCTAKKGAIRSLENYYGSNISSILLQDII